MFWRFSGDMPPPWSRMRIVTPGSVLEVICLPCEGTGAASRCIDSIGKGGGSGEAAIVTSIGSRSLPFSTVALNAFLRSSVRIYSRCVGTWASLVSGWPLMTTVGRTPYFSSQISETKDSHCRIISAGRRAVSITPMEVDEPSWVYWLSPLQCGCDDRCKAICCSAINLVPILARKCSSRNLVTSTGLMYFLHSRNPRASIGIVSAWVCTKSAMTSVNWISSSSVLIRRSW